MVGVTTTRGTVSKGCSLRKVETCWLKRIFTVNRVILWKAMKHAVPWCCSQEYGMFDSVSPGRVSSSF